MMKGILELSQQNLLEEAARRRAREVCNKMFVGPDDIRALVHTCKRIQVDYLPGNDLKLPRRMNVDPIDIEKAIEMVCPAGQSRLNLATIFARFVEQPGTALQRWTPLKGLISWSALQGRFEYILEHFVRHLPCGADKTISQMLTAIFERGREPNRKEGSTIDQGTYLMGVLRHTSTTPFMPFSIWTHAAIFCFSHSIEQNASRWLQSLLKDNSLNVRRGSFSTGSTDVQLSAPEVASDDKEIEIAIAAGGGSDVVAATAWLAHVGAPEGSMVFQPGRGKAKDYGLPEKDILVPIKDKEEPLTKGKQFYEGTDLAERTSFLSKSLGLAFKYFFLFQDKNLLSTGTVMQVLEHMNALADGIAATVSKYGRCRKIHLVDSGGDVLVTVLTTIVTSQDEKDCINQEKMKPEVERDAVDPRKERDVWNLLLAMALQERFNSVVHGATVQLVVMAPGIDGQSVWLGPPPAGMEDSQTAAG